MFVGSCSTSAVRSLTFAAIAAGAIVIGAATRFGGPWISVETPVNPYDSSTRGAVLLVHTFHHGTAEFMPVAGRAEGLVDGQRRSMDISLDKSSREGTYGVQRQWGAKGIWTLLFTATPREHGGIGSIQAAVDIGANGDLERVSIPRTAQSIPRQLTVAEVDRSLRERAKLPVAVGAR
ncbi:MAG TPA: hypothetical protein VGP25_13960 [Gemmatimonadaceae bacterium]|nr:hypothetical protein [Gemmatimonadaceae bacterium]